MAVKTEGITIPIGFDQSEAFKGIKDLNKQASTSFQELSKIERALKFNPGNTELVAQKMEVLGEMTEQSAEKLELLKKAQEEASKNLDTKKGQEEYRKLSREIIETESKLEMYNRRVEESKEAYDKAEREMSLYGKSMDDLQKESKELTDDLKDIDEALKMDPGNVDLIQQKYKNLGGQIENTTEEIERLKKEQDRIKDVDIEGFDKLTREIAKSESKLKELGDEMDNFEDGIDDVEAGVGDVGGAIGEWSGAFKAVLAGGAIAGIAEGVGKIVELGKEFLSDAMEMQKTDNIIKYSMDLDDAGVDKVNNAIMSVGKYGIESEEALAGVRKQFTLNKDAADESNEEILRMAGVITTMYSGLDFNEIIQESYEVANALEISQEEALALYNDLLSIGFPDSEIDIIAEYGKQLKLAGYSAEEIQAIFASGIDAGSWNVDNLMDGLKEGRIKLSEFAREVPDALVSLIHQTDISVDQFQELATAVANGGEEGKIAFAEIARQLGGMEDKTAQAELGVALYGTKWEDQGDVIIDTILGIDDHMKPMLETQEKLTEAADGIDDSALVRYTDAMNRLDANLIPIKTSLAEFASDTIVAVDESIKGANETIDEGVGALERWNNKMRGISETTREGTESFHTMADGTIMAVDAAGKWIGLVTEQVKEDFEAQAAASKAMADATSVNLSGMEDASSRYADTVGKDSAARTAALEKEGEATKFNYETQVTHLTAAEGAYKKYSEQTGMELGKAAEKMTEYEEKLGMTASEIALWADGVGESIDDFAEMHARVLGDAEKALDNYADTAGNGWGRIKQNETIGWKEYMKNMEANKKDQEKWWENLKILNRAGVDGSIIQELEAMGPAGASQVQRMVDELYKGGNKVGTAYDDMGKTTRKKVDEINQTVGDSFDSAAKIADEKINEGNWPGKGEEMVDDIVHAIALNEYKVEEAAGSAAKKGAEGFKNQKPDLYEAAEDLGFVGADGLVVGIKSKTTEVKKAGEGAKKAAEDGMKPDDAKNKESGKKTAEKKAEGIKEKTPEVKKAAEGAKKAAEEAMKPDEAKQKQTGGKYNQDMAKGMTAKEIEVAKAAAKAKDTIEKGMTPNERKLNATGGDYSRDLATGINSAHIKVQLAAEEARKKAEAGMSPNERKLNSSGGTYSSSVASGIRTKSDLMETAGESARKKAEAGMSPNERKLNAAGNNYTSSLAKGIRDGAWRVRDAGAYAAGRAEFGFRKRLDMHSPSKVMVGLGGNISESAALGVEKKSKDLERAMDDLARIPAEVDWMASPVIAEDFSRASLPAEVLSRQIEDKRVIDININVGGDKTLVSDPEFVRKIKTIILSEISEGNRTIPNRTSLIPI